MKSLKQTILESFNANESKTISSDKLFKMANKAKDRVLDAGDALKDLIVAYGDKEIPMSKVEKVLTEYDLDLKDVSESVNESFDAKKEADKIFKYFEDEGFFYESSKREISDAKKALRKAINSEEDLDVDYLTDEVLWDFSFNGIRDEVESIFKKALK